MNKHGKKSYRKNYEEEVGKVFGRLIITQFIARVVHPESGGVTYKYICKCDCGNVILASLANLKSGHTKSCGCYDREQLSKRRKTHGLRKHKLYIVWNGMRQRCYNPKNKAYKNYGGRGISVAPEWLEFQPFYDWAVSNGWELGLELDRFPDINGNYEPSNCRFATEEQQQNNKRNCKKYLYNGEWLGLRQIARKMGVGYGVLSSRLYHQKRPIERLFEPVKKRLTK
jgi:hypothetical protein